MSDTEQKYGAAALVGLPNAGKSTLTNALVGSKVSIVTRKRQTTRSRVTGIMMHENAQVILIDTPGMFQGKSKLEKTMVQAATAALDDCHVILHIVDAARDAGDHDAIIKKLPRHTPVILVLNKIDKVKKDKLLTLSETLNATHDYAATYMISALSENGVDGLRPEIMKHIPEGPWQFEEDDLTTQSMRFMAAEITREKIFDTIHQELPYSTHVITESWENYDNGSARVSQIIYVERPSQRAIILGKGGSKIKDLGQTARADMAEAFGFTVHLKLFVKVRENWSNNPEILKTIEQL